MWLKRLQITLGVIGIISSVSLSAVAATTPSIIVGNINNNMSFGIYATFAPNYYSYIENGASVWPDNKLYIQGYTGNSPKTFTLNFGGPSASHKLNQPLYPVYFTVVNPQNTSQTATFYMATTYNNTNCWYSLTQNGFPSSSITATPSSDGTTCTFNFTIGN